MRATPPWRDRRNRREARVARGVNNACAMKAASLLAIARARLLKDPTPLAVGFELTHLCNLACEYCDRHTKLPNEMTTPQILDALEGLRRLGMQEISLDGGEPLLHRDVDRIVGWLVERGVVVRMNTNGILVPTKRAVVERLSKVKISLDGPRAIHDEARGHKAFDRAIAGAQHARELQIPVEFTCVVGKHNFFAIDELIDLVERLDFSIIFQPARESLFIGSANDTGYRLDAERVRFAFRRIEHHKGRGAPVLNRWTSLRHFRNFPNDAPIPCAAGWINVTMDPEGNLHHCGQVDRSDKSCNVVRLGVEAAFASLQRYGCSQCWCARVVEENFAWGGRFDRDLPPRDDPEASGVRPAIDTGGALVPADRLVRASRPGRS
jgi:MoaA/NifB/PqqE/SkfB family radical SAM enzyme